MIGSCRMAVCVAVAAVAFGRSAIVEAQHAELEDVKYIQCFGGSDEAKALLAKQGFVVTAQQFPQMFSAYVDRYSPPFFVTEDSVWHTYHVLLEDGVKDCTSN